MDRRSHWEKVYNTKSTTDVSWYESEPATSLALIQSVAPGGGRIIDVGGGASLLVDRLVDLGNWEVTILDISATALQLAQARLQKQADQVNWIHADITEVQQLDNYDVWHDRAVFHFLTAPEDRVTYRNQLHRALRPGGYVVLGTFAIQGPEQCSGLPICRYDAESLAAVLGVEYTLVRQLQQAHLTPVGKTQLFTFVVFRKSGQLDTFKV